MTEVSVEALQEAIREQFGCDSVWVEKVRVKETFLSETVWEGDVQVFDLMDHPEAQRCYAWSHPMKDGEEHRFIIVLHQEPTTSPQAAVRVSFVEQFR